MAEIINLPQNVTRPQQRGYLRSGRYFGDVAAIWPWATPVFLVALAAFLSLGMYEFSVASSAMLVVMALMNAFTASRLGRPTGVLEDWLWQRQVAANRKTLATVGLTPEQYVATIASGDLLRRARAQVELGL